MQTIRKFIKNSKGATAIEYGLIAALIAVAAIAAMQGLGNQLKTTFGVEPAAHPCASRRLQPADRQEFRAAPTPQLVGTLIAQFTQCAVDSIAQIGDGQ
eukprot:gene3975-4703_t